MRNLLHVNVAVLKILLVRVAVATTGRKKKNISDRRRIPQISNLGHNKVGIDKIITVRYTVYG